MAGSAASASAPTSSPRRPIPPPARLVDIGGGRKLNLFCQGGGPVVLMETGFSDTTMTWRKVQAQIVTFATACSYDRAGLGFSDAADHPSDLVNNAEDLERLIKAAGLERPVLVGHSLGGLYVGYYARTHPGQVAGLVLVDPRSSASVRSTCDCWARGCGRAGYRRPGPGGALSPLPGPGQGRCSWSPSQGLGPVVPGRSADRWIELHAETDRQSGPGPDPDGVRGPHASAARRRPRSGPDEVSGTPPRRWPPTCR